jgi:WD40 repeat protein/serine/threonine protein kinase
MSDDRSTHPTSGELRALSLGQLAEAELDRVSGHLAVCTECCSRIDELAAADPLLARLQQSDARRDDALVSPDQRRSAVRAMRRMNAARAAERSEDAASESLTVPVPQQIGDYDILAEVGRGGMGVVYKARHRGIHRLAALKMVLAGEFASHAQGVRFRLEAELAARVQHPNIVQVYEVGSYQGRPFLVLEWVAGGSLADRLDGQPWPPGQTASLIETLARAIHVAHSEGVVHRDLKPANILLKEADARRKAGQAAPYQPGFTADPASGPLPKITDFGLARPIEGGLTVTHSGFLVGTPGYMAPEQAAGSGRGALVGPATDIYALGVILYQLLTGQLPFRGDSTLDVLRAVRSDEPERPRRLQHRVPRDLEAITLHCLEKEPNRRYSSALALAEDLKRFREGKQVAARPVGSAARLARACRRRPAVAMLLVLLLASLFGGLGGVAWMWRKAERNLGEAGRQRDEAERHRAAADAAQAQAKGEADRARTAEKEMRRQWYAATVNLMQQAWETDQLLRLRALLAETQAYPDRGFEWSYWQRLCHLDQHTFIGHRSDVLSVSWSPDGTRLATGSADGTAKTWDVAGGRLLLNLKGHASAVRCVAWSPDGTRLATGSENGRAKVWDATGGRELLTLTGHTGPVRSVAWSPDGTRLATGSVDETAKVWDEAGGRERLTLTGHTRLVWSVAWSPDGTRLATASHDGTAKVWDTAGGRELLTLKGQTSPIRSVAWSPDRTRLATGSEDGTAKLWDAADGRELRTLKGHTDQVRSVSWSPAGTWLATASLDGTAKVWDAAGGPERLTLKGHTLAVWSVAWSPDGTRLATGSEDSTAKLWDAVGGRERLTLKGHTQMVWSVSWSPDGTRLATASEDRTARVWDSTGGRELLTLKGHTDQVRSVSWSRDGTRLATASLDGAAKMWDAADGRELRTLKGHSGVLTSVCWSPDGTRLATGSHDGTAKVWDAADGRKLLTLEGHTGVVNSVAWSPDGMRLATGSEDGTAKLWGADGGHALVTLDGYSGMVHIVSWSPDGMRLAAGSGDGTAKVWDAASGRELLTLQGHTSSVRSVSWSRDGTRLATGSTDGTAKIWDAAGGRELLTFKGPAGEVIVAWSPDGRRLATGSEDSTANVWDAADPATMQQWARQDIAVQDLLDRNNFRSSQAQGFIQTWLVLPGLPFAAGESGDQALDRPQLADEASLRPRPGEQVNVGGQPQRWQEHWSPRAVVDFNAVRGGVAGRCVAYAVCYIESDKARDGLWLQVGSDDQSKVYLNGREIYEARLPHSLVTLDTVGPLGLERGNNVLLLKVANETGQWEGCARLIDDAGRPVEGLRVKLNP